MLNHNIWITEFLDAVESGHGFVNDPSHCNQCRMLLTKIIPMRWDRGIVSELDGKLFKVTYAPVTHNGRVVTDAQQRHMGQRNYVRIEKLTKREAPTLFN